MYRCEFFQSWDCNIVSRKNILEYAQMHVLSNHITCYLSFVNHAKPFFNMRGMWNWSHTIFKEVKRRMRIITWWIYMLCLVGRYPYQLLICIHQNRPIFGEKTKKNKYGVFWLPNIIHTFGHTFSKPWISSNSHMGSYAIITITLTHIMYNN